jgi:hypothetical protein
MTKLGRVKKQKLLGYMCRFSRVIESTQRNYLLGVLDEALAKHPYLKVGTNCSLGFHLSPTGGYLIL